MRLMARRISSTCSKYRVTFRAHHNAKFYIIEKSLHEGAVSFIHELQLNIIIIWLVVIVLLGMSMDTSYISFPLALRW